jgi:hypothetical protein
VTLPRLQATCKGRRGVKLAEVKEVEQDGLCEESDRLHVEE